MSSQNCSSCKQPLASSSGFVFCEACGVPNFFGNAASPFEVFGITPSIEVNAHSIEELYYELSKKLHPDRFASSKNALASAKALELSASLNQAYLALRNPESRLEALLKQSGAIKSDGSQHSGKQQIPADLAEEFFELQEALLEDNAKAAREKATLFRKKLLEKQSNLTENLFELAKKTHWEKATAENVNPLMELRRERSYIRSMLENLSRSEANL